MNSCQQVRWCARDRQDEAAWWCQLRLRHRRRHRLMTGRMIWRWRSRIVTCWKTRSTVTYGSHCCHLAATSCRSPSVVTATCSSLEVPCFSPCSAVPSPPPPPATGPPSSVGPPLRRRLGVSGAIEMSCYTYLYLYMASVLCGNRVFGYEQYSLSLVTLILVVAGVKLCLHIVRRHCLNF